MQEPMRPLEPAGARCMQVPSTASRALSALDHGRGVGPSPTGSRCCTSSCHITRARDSAAVRSTEYICQSRYGSLLCNSSPALAPGLLGTCAMHAASPSLPGLNQHQVSPPASQSTWSAHRLAVHSTRGAAVTAKRRCRLRKLELQS